MADLVRLQSRAGLSRGWQLPKMKTNRRRIGPPETIPPVIRRITHEEVRPVIRVVGTCAGCDRSRRPSRGVEGVSPPVGTAIRASATGQSAAIIQRVAA